MSHSDPADSPRQDPTRYERYVFPQDYGLPDDWQEQAEDGEGFACGPYGPFPPVDLEERLTKGDLNLALAAAEALANDLAELKRLVQCDPDPSGSGDERLTPAELGLGVAAFALSVMGRGADEEFGVLMDRACWALTAARRGGDVRLCGSTATSMAGAVWHLAYSTGFFLGLVAPIFRATRRIVAMGAPPGGGADRPDCWECFGVQVENPEDEQLLAALAEFPAERHARGLRERLHEFDRDRVGRSLRSEFSRAAALRLQLGVSPRGSGYREEPAAPATAGRAGGRDGWLLWLARAVPHRAARTFFLTVAGAGGKVVSGQALKKACNFQRVDRLPSHLPHELRTMIVAENGPGGGYRLEMGPGWPAAE